MFVPLSLPLGEEELGPLPTCYTQGTASIIVICSSVWLRHAAILGLLPGDPRCGDIIEIREQTIWEILEFCYKNQILGLIYRIRADAHGILVFIC